MSHLQAFYDHVEKAFEGLVNAVESEKQADRLFAMGKAFQGYDALAAAAIRESPYSQELIHRTRRELERYAGNVLGCQAGDLPDCIDLHYCRDELAMVVRAGVTTEVKPGWKRLFNSRNTRAVTTWRFWTGKSTGSAKPRSGSSRCYRPTRATWSWPP